MENEDLSLPPLKYLHEADLKELTEAIKGKVDAYVFAYVNRSGDDEEKYSSCFSGGKYTSIGLCEALKHEILNSDWE